MFSSSKGIGNSLIKAVCRESIPDIIRILRGPHARGELRNKTGGMNIDDYKKRTAFDIACDKRNIEIVLLLLEYGSPISCDLDSILPLLVSKMHIAKFLQYFDANAELNQNVSIISAFIAEPRFATFFFEQRHRFSVITTVLLRYSSFFAFKRSYFDKITTLFLSNLSEHPNHSLILSFFSLFHAHVNPETKTFWVGKICSNDKLCACLFSFHMEIITSVLLALPTTKIYGTENYDDVDTCLLALGKQPASTLEQFFIAFDRSEADQSRLIEIICHQHSLLHTFLLDPVRFKRIFKILASDPRYLSSMSSLALSVVSEDLQRVFFIIFDTYLDHLPESLVRFIDTLHSFPLLEEMFFSSAERIDKGLFCRINNLEKTLSLMLSLEKLPLHANIFIPECIKKAEEYSGELHPERGDFFYSYFFRTLIFLWNSVNLQCHEFSKKILVVCFEKVPFLNSWCSIMKEAHKISFGAGGHDISLKLSRTRELYFLMMPLLSLISEEKLPRVSENPYVVSHFRSSGEYHVPQSDLIVAFGYTVSINDQSAYKLLKLAYSFSSEDISFILSHISEEHFSKHPHLYSFILQRFEFNASQKENLLNMGMKSSTPYNLLMDLIHIDDIKVAISIITRDHERYVSHLSDLIIFAKRLNDNSELSEDEKEALGVCLFNIHRCATNTISFAKHNRRTRGAIDKIKIEDFYFTIKYLRSVKDKTDFIKMFYNWISLKRMVQFFAQNSEQKSINLVIHLFEEKFSSDEDCALLLREAGIIAENWMTFDVNRPSVILLLLCLKSLGVTQEEMFTLLQRSDEKIRLTEYLGIFDVNITQMCYLIEKFWIKSVGDRFSADDEFIDEIIHISKQNNFVFYALPCILSIPVFQPHLPVFFRNLVSEIKNFNEFCQAIDLAFTYPKQIFTFLEHVVFITKKHIEFFFEYIKFYDDILDILKLFPVAEISKHIVSFILHPLKNLITHATTPKQTPVHLLKLEEYLKLHDQTKPSIAATKYSPAAFFAYAREHGLLSGAASSFSSELRPFMNPSASAVGFFGVGVGAGSSEASDESSYLRPRYS